MIIVVCCGYYDAHGVKQECGATIGIIDDTEQEGISHGLCHDCYTEAMKVLHPKEKHAD